MQKITAVWKHGWHPAYFQVDPRIIPSETVRCRESTSILVAREDEASYLRLNGYLNVTSIGLPIVYTPDVAVPRQAGSLLIIPVHTLADVSPSWEEQTYVDTILSFRKRFDFVAVCVHSSCLKNGYWVKSFDRAGITIIEGADHRDLNSLERMRMLFSQFEYVTTNGMTSAIAYAAAFGAKVSIQGPFSDLKISDMEETEFYQDNPGLAQRVIPLTNIKALKENFEELFVDCDKATERIDWGRKQIGYDQKVSPETLKRLALAGSNKLPSFKLSERRQFAIRSIAKWILPAGVASKFRDFCVSGKVKVPTIRQKKPIQGIAQKTESPFSYCNIDGMHFHFTDAEKFSRDYEQIFKRHYFKFRCIYEDPLIIDCGAHTGLAVRYWLMKFPKARIIAFEPNPILFSILKENTSGFAPTRIDVHNRALWKEDSEVEFLYSGAKPGVLSHIQPNHAGEYSAVQAVRLSQFLNEPVEFLKINISGAETDVILEASGALSNVKRLWLEYHSTLNQPQRLSTILKQLEQTGFRYHIEVKNGSARPFERVSVFGGTDLRLNILGYRGALFPRTW